MLKNNPNTHHSALIRDNLWDAGKQSEIMVFIGNYSISDSILNDKTAQNGRSVAFLEK